MATSISGAVAPISEEDSLFGSPSNIPETIGSKGFAPQPLLSEEPTVKKQGISPAVQAIAPVLSGVGASQGVSPTSEAPEAITGAILSGVTGAAGGALSGATVGAAGGPIGAVGGAIIGGVVGLAAGGVKAWFGLKASRKADRERKRLIEKADKQRKTDIAKNEKWARINRIDNLKVAEDNRKQVNLQNKWAQFQNVQNNMFNMANREDAAGQNIRNQLRGAS